MDFWLEKKFCQKFHIQDSSGELSIFRWRYCLILLLPTWLIVQLILSRQCQCQAVQNAFCFYVVCLCLFFGEICKISRQNWVSIQSELWRLHPCYCMWCKTSWSSPVLWTWKSCLFGFHPWNEQIYDFQLTAFLATDEHGQGFLMAFCYNHRWDASQWVSE